MLLVLQYFLYYNYYIKKGWKDIMGKKHHSKKSKVPAIYSKIADLRASNEEFDSLVSEIDSKIELFINQKNAPSCSFTSSTDYEVNVKVDAVPLTPNQRKLLLKYLETKYLSSVDGDHFCIQKWFFSKKYYIQTRYYRAPSIDP